MQALLQPLSKLGEYEEIKNRIEKNRGILQLAGCIDSQKAQVIAIRPGTNSFLANSLDFNTIPVKETFFPL